MRSFAGLIILALFVSCSTLKTSSQKKKESKSPRTNQVEIIPGSPKEEEKIGSPSVIESESAPETHGKAKNFAVYIDSAGYDAFSALGFLQELEKNGLKPTKVVGVGFGCYVALAWASENSSNRAEWEAFKFDAWGTVARGNIVGRIVGRNGREKFKEEIYKNFSKRNLSDFNLPVDCPALSKKYPFGLRSPGGDVADILWTQLQLPSLAKDENIEQLDFVTGALAGDVSDREWMDLSRTAGASADFGGWIYLKTRSSFEAVGKTGWDYVIFGRHDREMREKNQKRVGSFGILNVDLGSSQSRNPEALMDASERRRLLVEGRKRAASVLPRIQSWLR